MTVGATQGGASLDPRPAPLRTARLELLEQLSRPGQAGATVCVGLGAERGAMPAGGTHALPTRAAAGVAAHGSSVWPAAQGRGPTVHPNPPAQYTTMARQPGVR